jgi:hypothetical protein
MTQAKWLANLRSLACLVESVALGLRGRFVVCQTTFAAMASASVKTLFLEN